MPVISWIVTAVICAALFTGLGAPLAPAASASTRPVYYAPTWHAEVRPGNIVFGADGGIWARYLRWQHWNGKSAYATGRLWFNTCNPTCSAGHYKKYRASVNLSRVRDHGKQPYYTRLTLRYWKNGRKLTHTYTLGGNGPQRSGIAMLILMPSSAAPSMPRACQVEAPSANETRVGPT